MRVLYAPASDRAWAQYYLGQASQSGAGFLGLPYQRGAGLGSIFRGLFRALLPVVKNAGKSIGRQALSTGAQIASDVVAGEPIKAAVKRKGKAGAAVLLQKAAKKLQTGGKRRRKRKTTRRKKRTTPSRRRKTTGNTRKRKTRGTRKRRITKRRKVTDQLGFYLK